MVRYIFCFAKNTHHERAFRQVVLFPDRLLENKRTLALSINIRNDEGDTPYHIAIIRGYTEIIEDLFVFTNEKKLSRHDMNMRNRIDQTLLHVAVLHNRRDIVKLLLRGSMCLEKANLEHKDTAGKTPLHLAAQSGKIPMIELLLANGASKYIKDSSGKYPYEIANDCNHPNMDEIKALLQ